MRIGQLHAVGLWRLNRRVIGVTSCINSRCRWIVSSCTKLTHMKRLLPNWKTVSSLSVSTVSSKLSAFTPFRPVLSKSRYFCVFYFFSKTNKKLNICYFFLINTSTHGSWRYVKPRTDGSGRCKRPCSALKILSHHPRRPFRLRHHQQRQRWIRNCRKVKSLHVIDILPPIYGFAILL